MFPANRGEWRGKSSLSFREVWPRVQRRRETESRPNCSEKQVMKARLSVWLWPGVLLAVLVMLNVALDGFPLTHVRRYTFDILPARIDAQGRLLPQPRSPLATDHEDWNSSALVTNVILSLGATALL